MVNYQNAKIYRLVCNRTGLQYIGSTTAKLCVRLSQHRTLRKADSSGTSKMVLEHDDYDIVLIEDFPCDRKEQLLARERWYIENYQCVNKQIPLQTQPEWYNANRERLIKTQMLWNESNKDKCRQYQKKYYEKTKSPPRNRVSAADLDNVFIENEIHLEEIYKCNEQIGIA